MKINLMFQFQFQFQYQYWPWWLIRCSLNCLMIFQFVLFFLIHCYSIFRYHNLLENGDNHQDDGKSISIYQIEVMHSSLTWSIMWFWRVLNAHALMQYLLFAVFVNRIWEFLLWAQYTGFISIGTLTFFSQIHVLHVESYLNRNQIKPTSLPDFNWLNSQLVIKVKSTALRGFQLSF